jgi:hypothetical protein
VTPSDAAPARTSPWRRLDDWRREPGAAGSRSDLSRCERTEDAPGFVCRWARARMSPARLVTLGHDLQQIVGEAGRTTVEVAWGTALTRTYDLDAFAGLPLENLRQARLITISADGVAGLRASVSLDATGEPALTATVRGPADVAQRVKDAVDLGHWNPVAAMKIVLWVVPLVVLALAALFAWVAPAINTAGDVVLLLASLALAFATGFVVLRLHPPVEIYSSSQTTVGSVLTRVVPIVAGVAAFAGVVFAILGIGA